MKISNESPARYVASGTWVPWVTYFSDLRLQVQLSSTCEFISRKERELGLMRSEPALPDSEKHVRKQNMFTLWISAGHMTLLYVFAL